VPNWSAKCSHISIAIGANPNTPAAKARANPNAPAAKARANPNAPAAEARANPNAPAAKARAERIAVLALDIDARIRQAQPVHGRRQRVKIAADRRVDACVK